MEQFLWLRVKCKAERGRGAAVFSQSVSEGIKSSPGKDPKGRSCQGEQNKRHGSKEPKGLTKMNLWVADKRHQQGAHD